MAYCGKLSSLIEFIQSKLMNLSNSAFLLDVAYVAIL